MIRIERRLTQPRYVYLTVPLGSLAAAFIISSIILLLTGHHPLPTTRRLFDAAFNSPGALTNTLIAATPLAFTGLAAAVAFRVNLFNIGAEGQLYLGAVGASAASLWLGESHGTAIQIIAMCAVGAVCGAGWALIPGYLRAYLSTNEIITSLMLNYVAGFFLNYLIFDSESYWRDTSTPDARVFPQGRFLPNAGDWWTWTTHLGQAVIIPFGFVLAIAIALLLRFVSTRTRLGFELSVVADSPRAARYAGIRTKHKILAVMAISGAIAGIGGAAQEGGTLHQLDPRSLLASGYGYSGIVVAALARYNPLAVIPLAFLLGGLQNAGFALQGADFPSGLVGVIQGVILFCALGGELLVRYRVRIGRERPEPAVAAA